MKKTKKILKKTKQNNKFPSKAEVLKIIKKDLESEFDILDEKMKILEEHLKIVKEALNLSNKSISKLVDDKECLIQVKPSVNMNLTKSNKEVKQK